MLFCCVCEEEGSACAKYDPVETVDAFPNLSYAEERRADPFNDAEEKRTLQGSPRNGVPAIRQAKAVYSGLSTIEDDADVHLPSSESKARASPRTAAASAAAILSAELAASKRLVAPPEPSAEFVDNWTITVDATDLLDNELHTTNATFLTIRRPSSTHGKNLRVGDAIVGVNDVVGSSAALLQEIRDPSEDLLRVNLRRVREFPVVAFKVQPFGLLLDEGTLEIEQVNKGAIAHWNETCPPGCVVMPTDVIVEVNGVRGSADERLEAIRTASEQVNVVIRRSCVDAL